MIYKLIHAAGTNEFNKLLNEASEKGFKPCGSIQVSEVDKAYNSVGVAVRSQMYFTLLMEKDRNVPPPGHP